MDRPFVNLEFERFIYRQGQSLASRDFRDQGRMEAARRWMHNSALHNTWGIALGFEVSLPGNAPNNKWDRGAELRVDPGIAYDCFGREMILAEPAVLTRAEFEDDSGNLPDGLAGEVFLLVLRYQECHKQVTTDICSGSVHSFRLPPPLLLWKQRREVQYGIEVPILGVSFSKSNQTVEASIRQISIERIRPQARPRMASGETVKGQTAWRAWEIQPLVFSSPPSGQIGLEVEIDTSSAGFQQQPCYFAWLNGPLQIAIDKSQVLIEPFVSLANEELDSFVFRVFLLSPIEPVRANILKWTVCWLGIEESR
jgi:hypothetical protein